MIPIILLLILLLITYLVNSTTAYGTILYIFILYVFIAGLYLLNINADLFSGFLWIIDFNLIFIFLLFGIYLLHIFKNEIKISSNTNFYFYKLLNICIFFIFISMINNYKLLICNTHLCWIINYINFYDIKINVFKINVFALYLTYFKINIDLFITINFILFFSIILVIYLYLNINQLKVLQIFVVKFKNYFNFQKHQNTTQQKHKLNTYMFFYMILKLTYLLVADTTNGVWIKTFHLYKGFFRKYTKPGLTARGSIRKIKVPSISYKSIKYKSLKVGYSRRFLIISSNCRYKQRNNFFYILYINSALIYGKRKAFKGSAVVGIMSKQINRRKYLNKAPLVL